MCNENAIEIVGVLETKTMLEKFRGAMDIMSEEWTFERNQNESSNDSIWVDWKTAKWKGTILNSQEQLIHARMTNIGGYEFDLTVVYDHNTPAKRRQLWEGINAGRPTSKRKDWLLIGDFNEIRHPNERDGHGIFDRAGAGEFESAIAGFTELDTVGGSFTWSNGAGQGTGKPPLDREAASDAPQTTMGNI